MNFNIEFYSLNFEDFYNLDSFSQSDLFFNKKIIVLKSKKSLPIKKLKSLCLKFGDLYKNPCGENFFVNKDPSILRVSDNNPKQIRGLFHNFELNWHNDFAHTPGDFHGTMLYNKRNGEKAITRFIDTQKAFETLPNFIKTKYKNLNLNHTVSSKAFVNKNLTKSENRLLKIKGYKIKGYFSVACLNGRISRPLFLKHPKTRKTSIYLSPATVDANPLKQDYSFILDHCVKQSQSFCWEKNDCLIFDNLSLTHSRSRFNGHRELYRCQFNYKKIYK